MKSARHPAGLYVLFLTEMWERFSFYTMAAVFMLYMTDETNGHPFLQQYASLINGLYVGTVYFTPFFGGILADRKLGYFWSIIYGAIAFAVGFFVLGIDHIVCFWLGLLFIVIGNGLFKPNISTLVGKLYEPNDARLDGAYTIFYMGINVGAFLAPLVAGYIRVHYGYHAAFAAAGVGMIVSLLFFVPFRGWLVFTDYRQPGSAVHPEEDVAPEVQRDRHIALLIIFVVVALFWMAFKQNTNTLPLWFKDKTDRTPPAWVPSGSPVLDKEGLITTEYNASINPLMVIVFSPLLVLFWLRLRKAGLEPSTPAKVGLGMLLSALGFGVLMAGGLAGADEGVRVSPGYLVGAFALITLAELCLSPMGLSLVSKLAAPRQRAAWMGGWFAATAIGGYLSGIIGQFWKVWQPSTFFGVLVGTSLLAGLILLACYGRLSRAISAPRPAHS
jgi:proton-dependent oligopeptide transporter, POT family